MTYLYACITYRRMGITRPPDMFGNWEAVGHELHKDSNKSWVSCSILWRRPYAPKDLEDFADSVPE